MSSGYGGGGGGGFGGGGGSGMRMQFGPAQTPRVIRELIIATAAAFVLQLVLGDLALEYGGLRPAFFWRGMFWQPFTSMFMHEPSLWGHLVFNLFFLWMFGSAVAEAIGRRRFFWLYFLGGAGGAALKMVIALFAHGIGAEWSTFAWDTPSIGASGAVFAVITVYCLSWPDREVNLFLLPLRFTSRWMLGLLLLIEFATFSEQVDHAAHLLGLFVGWLWLRRHRSGGDGDGPVGLLDRWRLRKKRGHLRVVRPKDDGPVFH